QSRYNSFTGESLGGRQSTGDVFFYGGDQVTVSFASPVNAFGLFFNVNLNSGTYGFTTPVGTASTDSIAYDTRTFVFAGLVAPTPFSSATFFSAAPRRQGSYNVPEIITASVPEPSALTMDSLGMAIVAGAVARSRRRPLA